MSKFPRTLAENKKSKGSGGRGFKRKGEKIHLKAQGLPARILQHEIDHLDGILFIDRIGFWQKWKIWKKLKQRAPAA